MGGVVFFVVLIVFIVLAAVFFFGCMVFNRVFDVCCGCGVCTAVVVVVAGAHFYAA